MMKVAQTLQPRGRSATRFALPLLLLLTIPLLAAWSPPDQTVTDTVVGQVSNGTTGGTVPEGLRVTLHTFSGMEETDVYTATLTKDHRFGFDGVSMEEGETLVARVVYKGVTYLSEFATPQPGEENLSLPVTIYETTQNPADVRVAQLHVFIDKTSDSVQLTQYAVVVNTGERTYLGPGAGPPGQRQTWSLALPDDAENLQFEGAELGGRFFPVENGFADTRPVLPGNAGLDASFTYGVPFDEGLFIEQAFDIPVEAIVLVMPEGEWALEGEGLSSEGKLETEMGPALSYTAGPLEADEPLVFTLAPRTPRSRAVGGVDQSNGLLVGVAALALAGTAIYWMWRSPSPGAVPSHVRSQVKAIATLDRDFENGRLPETSYRQKRRALKHRALAQVSESRDE